MLPPALRLVISPAEQVELNLRATYSQVAKSLKKFASSDGSIASGTTTYANIIEGNIKPTKKIFANRLIFIFFDK